MESLYNVRIINESLFTKLTEFHIRLRNSKGEDFNQNCPIA